MVDTPSYPSDIEPYVRPIPESPNRRRGSVLILLLLLLLFLCCCAAGSIGSDGLFTAGSQKARFIVRNVECLQCHTELIPEMGKTTVHDPFLNEECTVCHTPHGGEVRVTSRTDTSASVVAGTSWWDGLLSTIFGEDSWLARHMGTGEGSLYWRVFGPHPGSLCNRIISWFKWAPLRLVATVTGRDTGVTTGTSVSSSGNIADRKSELVMPEDELCMMCHGSIGKKMASAFPHDPVVKGQCTSCHDPHASDHGALLVTDVKKLCVTCHGATLPFDAMQLHTPFKNVNCLDCHDAHGSDFEGMIVSTQRELCFTCHPSVAKLHDKPYQHEPFATSKCTSCHEPHGSDNSPLLRKQEPELCYSCHPAIRTEFNQPSHHPISFNTMGCATCHDPHASDFPGLLDQTGNALCTRCHKALGARYHESAHFNTPCVKCHATHGSAFKPMLIKPNPELCLGCHVNYDEQDAAGNRLNRHPVRPKWYDVNAGTQLNCSTSCHDPHGTPHNYLLKNIDSPYDGNCIICHMVVPGWKVSVDY